MLVEIASAVKTAELFDSENRVTVPADGWRWFSLRYGCIWTAVVSLPQSANPDADCRPAIPVLAMIDSGSSHTFATRDVFAALHAQPTGDGIQVFEVGGSKHADLFILDVAVAFTGLDGALVLRDLPVSDTGALFRLEDRRAPRYDLVIGCDVLSRCRFTIDGPTRRFKLEAPTAAS